MTTKDIRKNNIVATIKRRGVPTDPYPQLNETRMPYEHVAFYHVPQPTTQCPREETDGYQHRSTRNEDDHHCLCRCDDNSVEAVRNMHYTRNTENL